MKKTQGRSAALLPTPLWIAALLLMLAAGLAGGFLFASRGDDAVTPHDHASGTEAPAGTHTVWTCSMHPQIQRAEPGLCPICAMDLIPVDDGPADAALGPREFRTTPEAAALMRVETALVERRFVEAEVRMAGEVAYDETGLAYITAWVPGRIERMYADFTGTLVRQGDHMVDLYSPELLAAKEELRRAKRAAEQVSSAAPAVFRETAESTLAAVRSKLRRWGMTDAQIAQAENGGTATDSVTIYAPIGGTVIERNGQEGMYVQTGERIYTIAKLDKVWVKLEAYESDLAWLHFGQSVEFTSEAYPGETFAGTIAFIDPTLDKRTRTVNVRVNVANEGGRLKPGMFVRATVRSRVATGGRVMDPNLAGKWISPMHPEIVKDGPGTCDICGMALVPASELGYLSGDAAAADIPLVIPASAPLITGKRAVVYVEIPGAAQPAYEGREVVLGSKADGYYLVRSGLREGERVVTKGNFKIDSALEIAAKPSMMRLEEAGASVAAAEPAAQRAAAGLFDAYVTFQEALAHDDLAAAAGAMSGLDAAAAALTDGEENASLRASLSTLHSATDLAGIRAAFENFSSELTQLIGRVGLPPGRSAYVLHCPMGLPGRGADWLQRDETVRNPYLGESMFSCGSVTRTLHDANASEPSDMPMEGSGHKHVEGMDHE